MQLKIMHDRISAMRHALSSQEKGEMTLFLLLIRFWTFDVLGALIQSIPPHTTTHFTHTLKL